MGRVEDGSVVPRKLLVGGKRNIFDPFKVTVKVVIFLAN